MGAAASIDQNATTDKQTAAILASKSANAASVDVQHAYTALQAKAKKTASEHIGPTSIHMLALRQLSQKLKNQESLERSKRKVLKSRSVPFNISDGSKDDEQINRDDALVRSRMEHRDDHDDLQHEDLEVVHDSDFALTPPRSSAHTQGATKGNTDVKHVADEHNDKGTLSPPATYLADDKHISTQHDVTEKETTPATAGGAIKKKKPMLSLQLSEHLTTDAKHTGDTPIDNSTVNDFKEVAQQGNKLVNGLNVANAESRVSPNGTLYMGKVKVMETGIVSSEKRTKTQPQSQSHYENIKRNFRQDRGYVLQSPAPNAHPNEGKTHNNPNNGASWILRRNESGRVISPDDYDDDNYNDAFQQVFSASMRQPSAYLNASTDEDLSASYHSTAALPSMSKKDFIEIATLGSGASGVVSEAIHVPTLTIVALKMLPVYNQEKRMHVARELGVLYRNLVEMRLIDDLFGTDENTSGKETTSNNHKKKPTNSNRCPNVLSLYNAFKDPASGMINLVVEYMDGGSLEDLVRQGGCQDEHILADIAFQTLTGLAYLHKNKNVHRDIKPANILCSSSGLIKIADFGISKALDKTTGFANSFVGTVSYMSPERITAENYSFPCDIWSLGLTILAVAKGRFPISTKSSSSSSKKPKHDDGEEDEEDDEDKEGNKHGSQRSSSKSSRKTSHKNDDDSDSEGEPMVIAGPGGYWAMIKAICDDDPPVAGRKFSAQFNRFIDHCLQKDAANRWSARQLLDESSFVLSHHQQQLMKQQSMRLMRQQSKISKSKAKLSIDENDEDDDTKKEPIHLSSVSSPTDVSDTTSAASSQSAQTPQQRKSALKARLTSVTLAKNNVDMLSPDGSSGSDNNNNNNNNNINNNNGMNYNLLSPTRLPLTNNQTPTALSSSSPDSHPHDPTTQRNSSKNTNFTFNVDWSDPSIWQNLGEMGNLNDLGDVGEVLRELMQLHADEKGDSDEDEDDLEFLGPEELAAIYAIRFEHLGTVLQKIAQKLLLHQSSPLMDDDADPLSPFTGYSPEHHRTANAHHEEKAHEDTLGEDELFQLAAPPVKNNNNNKQHQQQPASHSKSTPEKNRAVLALMQDDEDDDNDAQHHALPPRSPRLGDEGSASAPPNPNGSLMKQRSILKHTNNNSNNNNSTAHSKDHNSVHFTGNSEGPHGSENKAVEHEPIDSKPVVANKAAAGGGGGLRQRLQLKNLSLQVEDNDASDEPQKPLVVAEAKDVPTVPGELPRPSSYFIRSSQSKDEDDGPSHSNSGQSGKHSHLTTKEAKILAAKEYRRLLPKVTSKKDLHKWRHLAKQLHLPLNVVLLAARAFLGDVINEGGSN